MYKVFELDHVHCYTLSKLHTGDTDNSWLQQATAGNLVNTGESARDTGLNEATASGTEQHSGEHAGNSSNTWLQQVYRTVAHQQQ